MSQVRKVGLLIVAAALFVGTGADKVPVRLVPSANGYFLLAGDFHVHAALGDGGLAPWELAREARRRGLDVIAITNHNQLLAARVAAAAADQHIDPIILVGQEITAPRFHMIAAGITRRIDWRLPAADTVSAVQDQGGVAIAAHPVHNSWRADDERALRLLDGAEVAHPLMFSSSPQGEELSGFYRSTSQRNPGIAAIGSSDFHFGGTLGLCRTFLFVREVSGKGVLEAIREGRTVAFNGRDRFYGEPSLIDRVRQTLGDNPVVPRDAVLTRIAASLALAGLLVLLLFR